MGFCKLCLEEKPLLKESHIIPDFIYRQSNVYDKNHKITQLEVNDFAQNGRVKKISSSDYESDILCQNCDNVILGKLETYVSKAFYSKDKLTDDIKPICKNYKSSNGNGVTICENLNYTKLKLFLLSILWRANISSRDFFKQIQLGEHGDILRKMILDNNPMNYYDYPILIYTTITDQFYSNDIIVQPHKAKLFNDEEGYKFVLVSDICTY